MNLTNLNKKPYVNLNILRTHIRMYAERLGGKLCVQKDAVFSNIKLDALHDTYTTILNIYIECVCVKNIQKSYTLVLMRYRAFNKLRNYL